MQYQCMSTYCDIVSYTHFATKNGGITTNGHIISYNNIHVIKFPAKSNSYSGLN
ncbi:hypothetical protein NB16F81_50940 [Escherichia coli]|nr:hypothetical protein BvCmsK146A_01011 [Escherichia coli]